MLLDAEKYDTDNEIDVSNSILTSLCQYIEKYKNSLINNE